jgi:hypothetical protein
MGLALGVHRSRQDMSLSAVHRLALAAGVTLALTTAYACSLNPQPLPPGEAAHDASAGVSADAGPGEFGNGDGGPSGSGSGGSSGSSGSGGGSGGLVPPDGGEGGGLDAGDAGDAISADSPSDVTEESSGDSGAEE